jgi:hypothetical protein
MQKDQRWPTPGTFVGDPEPINLDHLHGAPRDPFDWLPAHRSIDVGPPLLIPRRAAAATARALGGRIEEVEVGGVL